MYLLLLIRLCYRGSEFDSLLHTYERAIAGTVPLFSANMANDLEINNLCFNNILICPIHVAIREQGEQNILKYS
jgi:hypothetical protein